MRLEQSRSPFKGRQENERPFAGSGRVLMRAGRVRGAGRGAQAVIFDGNSKLLLSSGSDNTFRVWG